MRWFTGDLNVIIYQTDGADIHQQQEKISLKYAKSKIEATIPLAYKVKKT
jgi:hypothetical protein